MTCWHAGIIPVLMKHIACSGHDVPTFIEEIPVFNAIRSLITAITTFRLSVREFYVLEMDAVIYLKLLEVFTSLHGVNHGVLFCDCFNNVSSELYCDIRVFQTVLLLYIYLFI
jgi:hypothetical protein